MAQEKAQMNPNQAKKEEDRPFQLRLPGFIVEEVGLGDAIKHATSAIGIRPCGNCARRAGVLNRWVVLSPWRSR
jgi:hypothetical protein